MHIQRASLQNLYEHDVKFPFATLFGGRKHRNLFDFFPESELGCGPHDPVGKFTNICHFKRDKRKARKFKKKKKNKNKQQGPLLDSFKLVIEEARKASSSDNRRVF